MSDHAAALKAKELLQQGDIQTALQVLQQNNSDEPCQTVLRELYLGEQNVDEAMPLLQQMATQDTVEGLVSQSILAFLNQDLTTAINLAEQATQQNPASATAYNHLGRALQNSGQSGKAIKAFKAAVRTDPEYAQAWHNLGHTRRALGVMDEAVAHYQQAINCHQAYQSAWYNLAITLSVMEQHQQALDAFDQLLKINDRHVLAWVNKGLASHVLGDHDQAINCYDQAMDLDPNLAMVYSYKGVLLNELQQSEQAIRCLNHALQLDPNEIDAWCELCDVFEKTNDLEQAEQANQKALSLDPHHPTALIDAARILKRNKDYATALSNLDQVAVAALPMRKATEYWFERAEVLDKMGRYEAAYDAYVQANNLAAQSPRYQAVNPQAFEQRLLKIKDGLTACEPLKKPSFWQRITGQGATSDTDRTLGSNLCFLIGFPRSGTTLVDTILSVNAKIKSVEEMPTIETVLKAVAADGHNYWDPTFQQAADWGQYRDLYWNQLAKHAEVDSDQLVLDKLPLRFLETEFIRQLFPQATFVFMLRHPKDVVISNFMQNYVPNNAFINFSSLTDTVNMYDQCMAVWLQLRKRLGDQLLELKYEDLVADPQPVVRKLCQFLQLRYSDDMLATDQRLLSRARVSTNSYAQVAEEINIKSVNRWQHYKKEFAPYEAQLNRHIKAFGY